MGQRWRNLFGVAAAAALTLVGTHGVEAAPATQQSSAVYRFDDMSEAGKASLKRNGSGVTMNIKTAIGGELDDFGTPLGVDWESGDATTVWFVVFNDPSQCIQASCGEVDVVDAFLGGDNLAKVGVHFGAGHVANGSKFNAAARLNVGDMSGVLFGVGLMDARAAEIHLVVRSHGPASTLTGQELAEALHSVDGGCDTNTCGDAQFAVFTP